MSERTVMAIWTPPARRRRFRCRAIATQDRRDTATERPLGRGAPRRLRPRGSRGPCSSAAEPGRPLLDERGNALRVVGRPTELALRVALDIELLGERALPATANRRLGPGEAARRRDG